MTDEQIYAKLQGVFDDVFVSNVTVTSELTAKDVEEWDSLSHVSLVLAIEEAFGVRFKVGEVEATKSVGDLAALIKTRLGG